MTIESATYISSLNASYPAAGDPKSEGDDHIRLVKSTVKATFPNVSGAVTPTHTELNHVDGVTSAIQTQLDAKAPLASPALTGTPTAPTATALTNSTQVATTAYADAAVTALGATKANLASPTFTGVPAAPTATAGTSTTQIATTEFVTATSFASVLPAQTGNSGKVITTDGTNASWAADWPGNTVTVAKGGTGATTLTANNVILGNGTSAVQFVAPGTSGNLLTSNGTTWQSTTPATLTVAKGGTGLATLTANNLIVGAGTGNVTFIAPSTSGNVLTSNGTTWTSATPSGTGGGSYTTPARALSTTYTNSGSTTRWVLVTVALSGSATISSAMQVTVNGSVIAKQGALGYNGGDSGWAQVTFPVPASGTYSILAMGGAGGISYWVEYQ